MNNNNEQFKACLNLVMSQTNYSEEQATDKLKKWDNNFIKVIKEYLNPEFEKKKKEKKVSLNQKIIGEIRKFKDKQCSNYIKEKNNEYEINKLLYLNSLKNEQNAEQNTEQNAEQNTEQNAEQNADDNKINIDI